MPTKYATRQQFRRRLTFVITTVLFASLVASHIKNSIKTFGLNRRVPLVLTSFEGRVSLSFDVKVLDSTKFLVDQLASRFLIQEPFRCLLVSPSIFQDGEVYFRTLCEQRSKGGFSFISKSQLRERRLNGVDIIGALPPSFISLEENGFEDCRGFEWKYNRYLICSVQTGISERKMSFVSVSELRSYPVKTAGIDLLKVEKNWTPLVWQDILFLIYSFSPLVVLECEKRLDYFYCEVVYKETGDVVTEATILRGGTPCIWLRRNQFFCFCHGRWVEEGRRSSKSEVETEKEDSYFYRGIVVVLQVYPFRILSVSSPLKLFPSLCSSRISRKSVEYPTGIAQFDDTLLLGVHFHDEVSYIFEVSNLVAQLNTLQFDYGLNVSTVEAYLESHKGSVIRNTKWCGSDML
ncbi:hypothetical protein GpartN1_g1802.t1 [Galdieria partita]|uniref:Uncharacterized protein n=1 Tax=Galdieria partita TaxID=83374 RepID=A0A9C7PTA3_9RHOD|nr:hypothetical protein GpartN1_g1802.t1 [Galdieria partita]